jgi:hypothetical protein
MAILNDHITLQEFNSTFVYNNRRPADFFRGAQARDRVLLPAGTILWKCTDYGLVNPRSGSISEWWADDRSFNNILQRSQNLGVSLRTFARTRFAVIWEWENGMTYLLRARLQQSVCGFTGQVAGVTGRYPSDWNSRRLSQAMENRLRENIAFIGGEEQYCIPNLTIQHVTEHGRTLAENLPFVHATGASA